MPVVAYPGSPDLLALHAANARRYPFFLQTFGGKGWDILFAFPQENYRHTLNAGKSFFDALDEEWRSSAVPPTNETSHLPFKGGWFIYAGYELLHELEPSVSTRYDLGGFPVGVLTRIPAAILIDREKGQTWLFAEDKFPDYLRAMHEDLLNMQPLPDSAVNVSSLEEEDSDEFLKGVARIKQYILDGDVFQVNLARRWAGELLDGSAADLYNRLRHSNPAPFAGIADFGEQQVVSSSPERLVVVRRGRVETRPIAGTHPRSPIPEEDARLRAALMASPKERAEHIMLIDLERNDLGRICLPGSVSVDELMAIETYAHVHHIESNVSGNLRPGITPGQVLRALFPGGTITGCPKVRTMQIIRELETSPRLAYTGSMGYLNRDGDMDMNILIRTFMLDGKQLSFKAGAGIVADSIPHNELGETRAKAKGLLKALDS